ncbi:hypothetical protein, partial [Proteus mirabilis]
AMPATAVPAAPPPYGARPDGVTGRAVAAARAARGSAAPKEIAFTIRGSTGNRYAVRSEPRVTGLYLRCSC